jgi:hypothetical protein
MQDVMHATRLEFLGWLRKESVDSLFIVCTTTTTYNLVLPQLRSKGRL